MGLWRGGHFRLGRLRGLGESREGGYGPGNAGQPRNPCPEAESGAQGGGNLRGRYRQGRRKNRKTGEKVRAGQQSEKGYVGRPRDCKAACLRKRRPAEKRRDTPDFSGCGRGGHRRSGGADAFSGRRQQPYQHGQLPQCAGRPAKAGGDGHLRARIFSERRGKPGIGGTGAGFGRGAENGSVFRRPDRPVRGGGLRPGKPCHARKSAAPAEQNL